MIENIDQRIRELDKIVRQAPNSKPIDWDAVIYNPPCIAVGHKNPYQIKEQAYFLVQHTVYEVQEKVRDVFYDGVDRWRMMQGYQGEHIVEIAGISQRLRTDNRISPEEKDTILRFLDPTVGELTGMPHMWFWLTMGRPKPKESHYFNEETGLYEVPSTAIRNILMFEMGAFFQIEAYEGNEARISERLQRMYPDERLRDDFNYWVEYIHHPDNSISGRMKRKFSVHQWLWETYHSLIVNRLFNPSLDFTKYAKPEPLHKVRKQPF